MTSTPSTDLERFDPFSPEAQQCPYPAYAAMRERQPVFKVPGTSMYLVTRHDLVVPILRDHDTFSNRFGGPAGAVGTELGRRLAEVQADGWPQVSTMLTEDPPAHSQYRAVVAPFFNPRNIAGFEPEVRRIAHALVDDWIGDGRVEVVTQLAVPLPVRVIAHVLNVPDDRLDDFKRWSDDSVVAIGALVDDDARVAAQRGIVEFQHYFADQIDARRSAARADLLTAVAQASFSEPDGRDRPLTMAEMLSIVQQLLVAGNETTTKMLTEGARLLAEQPDEWQRLRAERGRAAALSEEVLRLSSPTQGMFRIVTRDTELAGVPIAAGSMVVVMYAAANRDPAIFPDPDLLDPDRANLGQHLAFGKGIHFCIGAPLARLEARVTFEVLAERVASLALADGNTFEYEPSFVLRVLKRLDLLVTPA